MIFTTTDSKRDHYNTTRDRWLKAYAAMEAIRSICAASHGLASYQSIAEAYARLQAEVSDLEHETNDACKALFE